MNQNKLIDILESVAPQIVETHDPESVLLKAAADHNMYSAQLEKLGHAFNQWKTLVALDKQENRGDSFSILDVPKMVDKYASYDPHKKLSKKDKELHNKVDNIMKAANSDDPYAWMYDVPSIDKSASADLSKLGKSNPTISQLQSLFGVDVEEEESNMSYEIKQASEQELSDLDRQKEIVKNLNIAEGFANRLVSNTRDSIEQEAVKLANYLMKEGGHVWSEIVEDTVDRFGEKCASAIDTLETYFELNHTPYIVADMSKRAYAPTLLKDRHNQWDRIERVIDLVDMFKEASSALDGIEADRNDAREKIQELKKQALAGAPVPQGNPNPGPGVNRPNHQQDNKKNQQASAKPAKIDPISWSPLSSTVKNTSDDLKKVLNAFAPNDEKIKQRLEEAQDEGQKQLTLQQLILNDPILQEADPEKVEMLYKTIASISPTFAKDKNMMATALKEAVQYDAVPVNMIKDIASIEKDIIDTKLKQQNL